MKKNANTPGELLFGIHPIVELLKAKKRKIITLYTTRPEPKGWQQITDILPAYHIPVQYVARDVLTRMVSSMDHQGVVAWVNPFGYRKAFFDPAKSPFLVMLDGIQDPRNLGAILRSCYCTNVSGVIIVKKAGVLLNATAFKSSAGLAEHVEILVASSAEEAVLSLKKAGYNLYMATFDGKPATSVEFQMPLCVVIGGEGFGISKSIIKSGTAVTLPQQRADISYNASVAASILTFLIATQHQKI